MKKLLSFTLPAILFAALPLALQAKVITGAVAPNFTLVDSNGQTRTFSEFEGKYIVLEWTNHLCPFVAKHYDSGNMQKLQQSYTEKGAIWLTILSSAPSKQGYVTAAQANQLMKKKDAQPTAYLFDPEGKVGQIYGAKTTPHLFIINPERELIYQGAIDSIPSANPADIEKSRNYISAALDEAMAGTPVSISETRPYGCSVKYAKK